ncbi:MAG TPA: hypothetical protein VLL52_07130 [Anaerolineae bacterium]|nr:hypothetical protein [Anaerolineae bacterium]
MLTTLKQFLAPPTLTDPSQNKTSQLLNNILLGMISLILLFTLILIFLGGQWIDYTLNAIAMTVLLTSKQLLNKGRLKTASWLTLTMLFTLITISSSAFHGIRDTVIGGYFLIIILAGALLGKFGIKLFAALTSAVLIALFSAEHLGLLTVTMPPSAQTIDIIMLLIILSLISLLMHSIIDTFQSP